MGLTTKEDITSKVKEDLRDSFTKFVNSYYAKKEKQLNYFHHRYNSDTDESRNNKKERADKYRNQYQSNPEVREKQKERMRIYRQKKKALIGIA